MQAVAPAPSSEQENVEPASDDVKAIDAPVAATVPAGALLIVVCGAVVSTVQLAVAADGSALPAASVAMTETVWAPSARPA